MKQTRQPTPLLFSFASAASELAQTQSLVTSSSSYTVMVSDAHGGRAWRLAAIAGSAALLCASLATTAWHASPHELESLSTPQTFSSTTGWSGATSTSLGDDSLFNELIERQLVNSNVVGDVALPAAQEFLAPRPHTASLPAYGDVIRMLSSGLSWPHAAGDSDSQQTAGCYAAGASRMDVS